MQLLLSQLRLLLFWLCFINKVSGTVYRPPSRRASNVRGVIEPCPARCLESGGDPRNWPAYPNFKQIKSCQELIFAHFSLYDPVDLNFNHRIHACSSFGPDFSALPSLTNITGFHLQERPVSVTLEIGWWEEGFGLPAAGIRSLIRQIRTYLDQGYGDLGSSFTLFGRSGQATLGIYIGKELLGRSISQSALEIFHSNLESFRTETLAMQFCGPRFRSSQIFGVVATSNGTFSAIQEAMKNWMNARCLSFSNSTTVPGQVVFTLQSSGTNVTSSSSNATSISQSRFSPHAICRTVQVEAGDSCASLALKCGISGAEFAKINPGPNFCSTLKPRQRVCCTSGELPDLRPKPNPDGSCHAYQIQKDDNCANLAVEYGLTIEDIERFNKKTWGWNGCKLLWVGTVMCLSSGTPPFPAPISNAVCGPQKPGTKPPTDGTDISTLNPCPLRACCNIWGQCGTTKDFCIDTNTGAPGTAAPGTYGCISNCGLDIVKGDGTGAIRIGYYEGFGLCRECLFQDVSQIATSQFTHVHFAFGLLTDAFDVKFGDPFSAYQFKEFKRLKNVKKILSFGGWAFSTDPSTYHIFRNAVTPANRIKCATNIANFIKQHNLDGVDIDWEYPGAPDIPGIPPGNKEDGTNYLGFLILLKRLLPGKTVSIAAPASYWYLKQYPIYAIGQVVDYIVYMTYDLHGSWDTGNRWSQEGCPTGNCLRSHVNLTETKLALAMITKAGVPGRKVVVGVSSYGRSFDMLQPGCWGPDCFFNGNRINTNAKKGKCTATSGYIADAEVAEILQDPKRVVRSFVDKDSDSDILVYDTNQWVGYMSNTTKHARAALYASWGLGGTTDWATDLQKFNPVPAPAKDWETFKRLIELGENPKLDHTRDPSWVQFDCSNDITRSKIGYPPSVRWKALNSDAAWEDIIRIWKNVRDDNQGDTFAPSFLTSITETMGFATPRCDSVLDCGCDRRYECPNKANNPESGPAAEFIMNSLVEIHRMYHDYYRALTDEMAIINTALDDMENTFAPVPEPDDKSLVNLLVDLLTLGTLSIGAGWFNTVLKQTAYFRSRGSDVFDNIKDVTQILIGQGTTIAKDVLPDKEKKWSQEGKDKFTHYLGDVVDGWLKIVNMTLVKIFDGSDSSIDLLWKAMSDGKLIEGKVLSQSTLSDGDRVKTLRDLTQATVFAFGIPALWRYSGNYAFVMDSGLKCSDSTAPLSQYLEDDVIKKTSACIENKQYYLVYPRQKPTRRCWCTNLDELRGLCLHEECRSFPFAGPPGLDELDGEKWAGLRLEDFIKGALKTWEMNGWKNDARLPDPNDEEDIKKLMRGDVKESGLIRLPVCSPERAYQSWDTSKKGSTRNYPCDIPPGLSFCGISTFVDQTSGASPSVKDCEQIIRNIEGDGKTSWRSPVVFGKPHRTIAKFGGCSFGVEATNENGNIFFDVGGQDVIDLINDAVQRFGKTGKVGALGFMKCKGNIKDQEVKWGIF